MRVSVSGSTFHFYINNHLIYSFCQLDRKATVGLGMYDMSGGDATTFSADWAVLYPSGGVEFRYDQCRTAGIE